MNDRPATNQQLLHRNHREGGPEGQNHDFSGLMIVQVETTKLRKNNLNSFSFYKKAIKTLEVTKKKNPTKVQQEKRLQERYLHAQRKPLIRY